MYLLEIEGKTDSGTGGLEREKTPVSGPIDDPPVVRLCEFLDMIAVAGDQFPGKLIALFRFKGGGPDKVRKDELLDTCLLYRFWVVY